MFLGFTTGGPKAEGKSLWEASGSGGGPLYWPMDSPWKYFWAGFRAQAPFLLGVVPFGLVSGLAAVKLGAPPLVAACMSFIVYAGASQLVAMDLYARGRRRR
jgi:hypothetical protein